MASVVCRHDMTWALRRAVRENAFILRLATLAGMALMAAGAVCRARLTSSRSSAGRARFAYPAELWRLARHSDGAWLPLGYLPRPRFLRVFAQLPLSARIRRAVVGPLVRLPAEDLSRHLLAVGLTGSHKTTAVVFPVLLEAARHGVSVVALDLKYGEADSLVRAAPEWQRYARDVLVFAPLEATTLRWNPLLGCRTMGDAQQIASQLFYDPDPSDPDMVYWMGAERHVCAVLCYAVGADGGQPTLGRLRALCESGPTGVHAYVQAHPRASQFTTKLGAYLAMLPKDQAGILQGIASRLEAWGDEAVCAATGIAASWELVDFNRLRSEPVLLIIGVPQATLGRLRWLCHLFLRDLAANLLRPRDPQEQVRVLLVLEELPAWGALPGLADYLATYRSRQVSVIATLQSEAQGEHVYGRDGWAAVAANLVTKLYLPSLADVDADRLSRVMGTAAGEDVARSQGWGSSGPRRGEQRRAIPVPLERPEELRGAGVSPDEILVRFARMSPARLWCPPYYLRPEYAGRVPGRLPKTQELVVYHHLWIRHMRPCVGVSPIDPSAIVSQDPMPPPESPLPVVEHQQDGVQRAAPPSGTPTPEDIAGLNRLLEALLQQARCDRPDALRGIRSRGRIFEVRVDPRAVMQVCGRPETMYELARRWSSLRWLRRVHPSFVLSKLALDALDERLARRLHAISVEKGTKT